MKTKLNFKIASQTIAIGTETVTTPDMNIETEVEATLMELKELYELQKLALKEAPELAKELLKGLYGVYQTCNALTDEVETQESKEEAPIQTDEKKKGPLFCKLNSDNAPLMPTPEQTKAKATIIKRCTETEEEAIVRLATELAIAKENLSKLEKDWVCKLKKLK